MTVSLGSVSVDSILHISNLVWFVAEVGAYVLNFNGRVTMASVKNFQLVPSDDRKFLSINSSLGMPLKG